MAAPASAATYIVQVIASGLNNPRDLAFGPDGALYIAETGLGVAGPLPPGETLAFTGNGSITRLLGGSQDRFITGLPSLFDPAFNEVRGGPTGIVFDTSGLGHVVIGLGADPAIRPPGSLLGHVLTFTTGGAVADFADISALEASFNPVGPPDSNPFYIASAADGFYVTDAGANTLNLVEADGATSIIASFAPRFIGPPVPFSDSVPTGVAIGPDGTIYMAELTGFPFTPGAARIYAFAPGSTTPTIFATGLTTLSDLAIGPDGTLYALSLDTDGLANPTIGGGIFRISSTGASEALFTGIPNPIGFTVGGDGAFYVSINSVTPAAGQVIRISALPEPATWAMMLLGFAAVGATARRSKNAGGVMRQAIA